MMATLGKSLIAQLTSFAGGAISSIFYRSAPSAAALAGAKLHPVGSLAHAADIFNNSIMPQKWFKKLMEPVLRAYLQKHRLDAAIDGSSREKMAELEKNLNAWSKENKAPAPDSLLWGVLFVHTFPAYAEVQTSNDDNLDVPEVTNATGTIVGTYKVKAHIPKTPSSAEIHHVDDLFSLLQIEMQLVDRVDVSALLSQRQTLGNEEVQLSQIMTPYFGSIGGVSKDQSTPAKITLLKYSIDRTYLKIVDAATAMTKSRKDKSFIIPANVPGPKNSVRGCFFAAKTTTRGFLELVASIHPAHIQRVNGVVSDWNTNVEFRAVYWLPGFLREQCRVADVFQAAKNMQVKPVLLCLLTFKKKTDGSWDEDAQVIFMNEAHVKRLTRKGKVHREVHTGARVSSAEAHDRSSRFGDDEDSDFDDDDLGMDEGADSDMSLDEDSDPEEATRIRFGKIGVQHVPVGYIVSGDASPSETARASTEDDFATPLLTEKNVHGLNAGLIAYDKTIAANKKHIDNVLQQFLRIVKTVIDKTDDPEVVSVSAILRLRGNHVIYRESAIDAAWDILETKGQHEKGKDLFAFEMPPNSYDSKIPTDDDMTARVPFFRLPEATLPSIDA